MASDEKKVDKTLCGYARSLLVKAIKLTSANDRGQPDRMFLFNGRALFIEMKGLGKKPTTLQLRYLEQLRELGFVAEWVDNVEDGKKLIDRLVKDRSELKNHVRLMSTMIKNGVSVRKAKIIASEFYGVKTPHIE